MNTGETVVAGSPVFAKMHELSQEAIRLTLQYTDCGKNIHFGKRVFVNSGCKFQDQGGIPSKVIKTI